MTKCIQEILFHSYSTERTTTHGLSVYSILKLLHKYLSLLSWNTMSYIFAC